MQDGRGGGRAYSLWLREKTMEGEGVEQIYSFIIVFMAVLRSSDGCLISLHGQCVHL